MSTSAIRCRFTFSLGEALVFFHILHDLNLRSEGCLAFSNHRAEPAIQPSDARIRLSFFAPHSVRVPPGFGRYRAFASNEPRGLIWSLAWC